MKQHTLAALALVGVLGLTSCLTVKDLPPVVRMVALTEHQTTLILDGLRSVLKDPQSAILGRLKAGAVEQREDSPAYVCGYVNAKNSFGGYVGDRPFFGLLRGGSFMLGALGNDRTESEVIYDMCNKLGLGS